ncbi:TPA: AAA family ATPase [Vibrio parahaemolyticus]|nr:AAA family ATPase [Vibrio parahaemolyticus]
MKFHIKNLGKIKQADIEVNDLTIICGPNSSNKTWLSYFINHCLNTVNTRLAGTAIGLNEELNECINDIIKNGSGFIDLERHLLTFKNAFDLCSYLAVDKLPSYFNLKSETFSNTEFTLDNSFGLNTEKQIIIEGRRVRIKKEHYSNLAEVEVQSDPLDKKIMNGKFFGSSFFNHVVKREIYTLITKVYVDNSIPTPFVITSERTGCMVFQPEIDRTTIKVKEALSELGRISDLDSLPEDILVTLEELSTGEHYTYASPVKHNVNVIRDANLTILEDSFIKEHHPEVIQAMDKVNGGTFSFANSQLVFTTEDSSTTLPVTISSSSVKSLFLLDLYIKSMASPNDLLLIDEPELNLHPDNQRLMARVIARLVNTGVKVLITTHSDYLIREINNAIALSNDFEDKEGFLNEHGLIEADTLDGNRVSAYAVDKIGIVAPMAISKFGIETALFDELINNANYFQDDILEKIEPSLFED